jgi:hypothetical protein
MLGFLSISNLSGMKCVSRHTMTISKTTKKSIEVKKGYMKAEPFKSEKGTSFYDMFYDASVKGKVCGVLRFENHLLGAIYGIDETDATGLLFCIFEKVDWLKYDLNSMLSTSISDRFSNSLIRNYFIEDTSKSLLYCTEESIKIELQKLNQSLISGVDFDSSVKMIERLRVMGQVYQFDTLHTILSKIVRLSWKDQRMEDVCSKLDRNTSVIPPIQKGSINNILN